MPDKSHQNPPERPDLKRWGGPGASHEDRTEEPPEWSDPRAGGPTNTSTSRVSGGGGERDIKHSHDDEHRSSKTSKGGRSDRSQPPN